MGYNGAGVYTLPPGSIISDGTSADAADLNTPLEDLEDALNLVHISDGRKAAEANWPMGGFKLTGLADGSAATDSATIKQAQVGVLSQATTVGGTADAITLSFTPAIAAYTTGMKIRWTSGGACTVTNPTVNVHSLGAKTIKKGASAALVAGDTGASAYQCEAVYDGTDFILLNPASGLFSKASTTDVLTGTDTEKLMTADSNAALWEKGSDIASGTTITVGEGGTFDVTGTTTITDIDPSTDKAGRLFRFVHEGVHTLTHHATTMILLTGANITTAVGDVSTWQSEGSDAVRMIGYERADGSSLTGMTLIGTLSTTGASTSSLTSGTWTGFRKIILEVNNLSAGAGSVEFSLRITNNGGTNWSTGTTNEVIVASSDMASAGSGNGPRGVIELTNTQSTANGGIRGFVILGSGNTLTPYASMPRMLCFNVVGPINGLRIQTGSDSIDEISIPVYGVK